MRRWLAILMLALLPLQFSWAAVAAYCGHEAGAQAQHLGHHEHQHSELAVASPDTAPAGQGEPTGFDFDCGHCHGCGASLPAPMRALCAPTLATGPAARLECAMRSLAQSPPERPQWPPLA